MHEQHHVGILLYGTRLSKVAQLWAFSFRPLTSLYCTVKLRQGQHRNVKLLRQPLQRTADGRDLLLPAAKTRTAGVHKLQVVNHYQFYAFFPNKPSRLCTQLEYRHARRIINVYRRSLQPGNILVKPAPFLIVQLSVQYLLAFNLTDV